MFDFLTFGDLLLVFATPAAVFRTGWFVESLLTELVIALVVRTRRPFFSSRPGRLLWGSTAALVAVALILPYVPAASVFGFVPLPAGVLAALCAITAVVLRDRRSRQALVAPSAPTHRACTVSMMFSRFVLARRFFPENRGRHESSGARDLHEGLARLIEVAEEKGYAGHALVNVRLAIIIPPVHRPVRLNRIYATSPTRYIRRDGLRLRGRLDLRAASGSAGTPQRLFRPGHSLPT